MLDEAHQILGVSPDADGRTIATAYWARARELAGQRAADPEAAKELERLNLAYQALANDLVTRVRPPTWKRKPSLLRRVAVAGVLAAIVAGGAYAGLGYRAEITDGSTRGLEEAQEGWDGAVEWLQELDAEPTLEPPDATTE